jgi:hypothetical protein
MIDLEEQLRVFLRAYADTMPASEPPTGVPSLPQGLHGERRRTWQLVAAAAVVIALVVGLVAVTRSRHHSVLTPTASIGHWIVPATMPLSPRQFPSVLWTGREFIVWGGQRMNVGLSDGAIYDPASNTWRPMAANAQVRPGGLAVWADTRMVVLSGTGGMAYDPVTDRWSTMPELQGVSASDGFTDAVWTHGTLLGIGVGLGSNSSQTSIRVWRLDETRARWIDGGTTATTGVGSAVRMVSVADQFFVHDPVVTDDGFAFWEESEGLGRGLRWSMSKGWEHLPALGQYDGNVLIQFARLVWADGRLVVVAMGQTPTRDDMRVASLTDAGWSAWSPVADHAVLGARPVSAGTRIVVLGAGADRASDPLLVHPALGDGTAMTGSRLTTVLDQGTSWSGRQLLICGGQTSESGGMHTTADPLPWSNQCSLWTP